MRRVDSHPRYACNVICWISVLLVTATVCLSGCGTSRSRLATDQLLTSDAVDKAVDSIDFGALNGKKVYFDTQFVKNIKGVGFVNADYVISSLRNQMVAAGCQLQDKKEEADVVVEARIGTLGHDQHEISYGIPASSMLSTAANLFPNAPPIPAIPEMSIAKKNLSKAAAKIAVFAYQQKSRRPVWQSGIAKFQSDTTDVWLMGAGPFQSGSFVDRAEFAGTPIAIPLLDDDDGPRNQAVVSHTQAHLFSDPLHKAGDPKKPKKIQHAEFLKPIPEDKSSDGKQPAKK